MFFEKMLLTLSTLMMLAGSFLWFWRSPVEFQQQNTESNTQLLSKVGQELSGEIVFDSNRSGSFGIYTQKIGQAEPTKVVDSEFHDMFPDPSPDGKKIVFARHNSLVRGAPGEIWIADRNGENQEKIVTPGTFPSFSADGNSIFFERSRTKVFSYSLSDKSVKEIFPAQFTDWNRYKVVKPRISADGKFVHFTSDRGGRWNAYYVNLENGEFGHVGRGCEPVPFSKANKVAWITKSHVLSKSGIGVFDRGSKARGKLHDAGPPYGHEYFPTLVNDDQFLLYAACPGSQHDHNKANYQIFVRNLHTDEVVRVSHDKFTNRWPKYIP